MARHKVAPIYWRLRALFLNRTNIEVEVVGPTGPATAVEEAAASAGAASSITYRATPRNEYAGPTGHSDAFGVFCWTIDELKGEAGPASHSEVLFVYFPTATPVFLISLEQHNRMGDARDTHSRLGTIRQKVRWRVLVPSMLFDVF
jgi:hypothetical protein